jgi:hypothetical protein
MPRVKAKQKTKRIPLGWKKENSNFIYYFKDTVARRFKIKKIEFLGFKSHPVGLSLYSTGGGFNRRQSSKIGGDHFLGFFESKYRRELRLSVFSNGSGSTQFKVQKRSVTISILFDNFIEILKDLGAEIKINKEGVVAKRLSIYFPNEFKDGRPAEQTADSKLSDINLNSLKDSDHDAIGKFIKKYISINSENDEVLEKLQTDLVIQGRKKTLDQVIKKFEKHLKDKNFDEKRWQKFLHEEVFFFLSNYIESIREANVNFGKTDEGEKKPDFVWIDIYGFLDVFEIKTPQTDILAKRIDKSHNNYYFSSDASRAIAQIEKYVLFLEKNVENFEKYISKKTKIPFSVLKPKAFLIIGTSKEFSSNPEKKKDFRLLRRLFKNIEFVTFDEMLDNLKNLASKFGKDTN